MTTGEFWVCSGTKSGSSSEPKISLKILFFFGEASLEAAFSCVLGTDFANVTLVVLILILLAVVSEFSVGFALLPESGCGISVSETASVSLLRSYCDKLLHLLSDHH